MSNAARAATVALDDGPGGRDGRADPVDRVVALFSGALRAPPRDADGDDWSASLTAVRGVASQVRTLQTNARDSIREAQRSVREAETAVRAAEDRAEHAEGLLRAAVARAERAEEQARAAAERAEQAEARTAEARAWLRRMHECMVSEFGALSRGAAEP